MTHLQDARVGRECGLEPLPGADTMNSDVRRSLSFVDPPPASDQKCGFDKVASDEFLACAIERCWLNKYERLNDRASATLEPLV